MPHIYKITSPKGRIYIGSSVNVKVRFRKYRSGHCQKQTRLYASFLKYGVSNHLFEILCECTKQEMYHQESVYGAFYDVLGKNGLNCLLPKNGDAYKTKSDEVIEKIRKANTGKVPSDDAKNKNRIAHLGKTASEETKKILREKRQGRRPGLGKKNSPETIERKRSARMKFLKKL